MSNTPKVLLFGSFTEGETHSYLNKKSDESKKSQVHTTNHTPLLMFGNSSDMLYLETHTHLASSRTRRNQIPKSFLARQKMEKLMALIMLDSFDMFPRGNLCFLNATLQGLLACSPFVQLLQRLRNCNIAKARHPTVASFVEFIAKFDAVGGSNMKKKDVSELETGMPFSPIMFEGVLRKFTPDVSSTISKRPRQEDAQGFLSFIMDQVHDDLLKLGWKKIISGFYTRR